MSVQLTQERALYLWGIRGIQDEIPRAFCEPCSPFGTLREDGLTLAEDLHVRRVWAELPGWTSWSTAFGRIRRGEA